MASLRARNPGGLSTWSEASEWLESEGRLKKGTLNAFFLLKRKILTLFLCFEKKNEFI